MALPAGIQTCEVRFGAFTDFQGNPVSGSVTFTPSRSLIWVATGVPILSSSMKVDLDSSGSGSINLPYTDQPGFSNGAGQTVVNWTYRAVFSLGGVDNPPPVSFQVPSGPLSMDLDLVTPMASSTGVTVALPSVLSVNGQTGNVTVSGGGGSGITVSPTAPTSPALNALWLDTSA